MRSVFDVPVATVADRAGTSATRHLTLVAGPARKRYTAVCSATGVGIATPPKASLVATPTGRHRCGPRT